MKLIVFLLISLTSWGGQSLAVTSTGTVTYPTSLPWTSIGTWTGGLRISSLATPSGFRIIYDGPAWRAYLTPDNEICADDKLDSLPDYGNRQCALIPGGVTDISLTIQRDTAALRWRMRVWNVATGARIATYCGLLSFGNAFDCPIASLSGSAAGTGTYGSAGTSVGTVAWIKMLSGLGQLSQPYQQYNPADLWNVLLEGNGNDSSGRGINLTVASGVYTTTPAFGPVAVIRTSVTVGDAPWVSMRSGTNSTLSGSQSYSRGDTPDLTYYWIQTEGPTSVIWDNNQIPNPTITGLRRGKYSFGLTVKDATGLVGQTYQSIGSVAMDSNGVVVNSDPRVDEFLMPQIAFGKNPWPWFDNRHWYFSNFFGQGLTAWPEYTDTWHPNPANTAQFTNGSTTVNRVTGVDMNSLLTDCVGSGEGDKITIPVPQTNGVRLESPYVASCSAGSVTLRSPYTGTSGTKPWGTFNKLQQFQWSNGGTNANYYDVVLGHLSMYYRSGDSTYRDYACTLARRWWTSPVIDRNLRGLLPRVISPIGMAAAFTLIPGCMSGDVNTVDFWSDYDTSAITDHSIFVRNNIWPGDWREEAARNEIVAVSAKWSTNPVTRATLLADLNTGWINKWVANYGAVFPALGGVDPPLYVAQDGERFDVTVTTGDANVTGTALVPGVCVPALGVVPLLWFFVDETNWDQEAYNCTYNSPTSITLDRPYQGSSGNKKLKSSNIVGPGKSPWITGWGGRMYRDLNLLGITNNTAAYIRNIVEYTSTRGYYPAVRGVYYARESPGCEPIGASVPAASIQNCVGSDGAEASRFYVVEALNTFSADALLNNRPAQTLQFGDIYYGSSFGKLGGPETPLGYYYSQFDDNALVQTTRKAKDYGFAFGFGAGAAWPAARLGGVAPPDLRNYFLSTSVRPGTTTVTMTYTQPNGETQVAGCPVTGLTANCVVQVDFRQGVYGMYSIVKQGSYGTETSDTIPLRHQSGM